MLFTFAMGVIMVLLAWYLVCGDSCDPNRRPGLFESFLCHPARECTDDHTTTADGVYVVESTKEKLCISKKGGLPAPALCMKNVEPAEPGYKTVIFSKLTNKGEVRCITYDDVRHNPPMITMPRERKCFEKKHFPLYDSIMNYVTIQKSQQKNTRNYGV